MKKLALIVVGLLASLAVGAAGGYAVGRHGLPGSPADAKTGESAPDWKDLPGSPADAKTGESAPDWKEWKYPECSEHESSTGGGTQTSSGGVPPHFCLVMATPDDYERVLRYYGDKAGIPGLEQGSGAGTKVNTGGPQVHVEEWFVLNDSHPPNRATQSRPVKMKMFGRRTLTYDLTMLISRANDEKHTHIVLAFYPRQ
jgi:hypothetical protein